MMEVKKLPNGTAGTWVRFILQLVIIPMAILVAKVYVDVQVIKGNRWSSADQARYAERVLLMLESKADKVDVPPPEVRQALADLRDDIREIKGTLRDIQKELK